jgi:hypothetical protein
VSHPFFRAGFVLLHLRLCSSLRECCCCWLSISVRAIRTCPDFSSLAIFVFRLGFCSIFAEEASLPGPCARFGTRVDHARIFLFACACPLARFPCTSWPLLVSIPCSCLRYFPLPIFGAQDSFWLSGFPSSCRFGWHRSWSSHLGFPVLDFWTCAGGFIDSRSRAATRSAVWFLLPLGIWSAHISTEPFFSCFDLGSRPQFVLF